MNNEAFEPVIDVFASICYLGGIAVIEVLIRPLFGNSGIPTIANIVLFLGDAVLILSLLLRAVKALDRLWKAVRNSSIYHSLETSLTRSRPSGENSARSQNDHQES